MSLVLCYRSSTHFNVIHDIFCVQITGNKVIKKYDGMKAHVLSEGNIILAYTGVSEVGHCASDFFQRNLIDRAFESRSLLLNSFSNYVAGINNGFGTTVAAREIEQAGFSTETGFAVIGNFGQEELFHLVSPSGKIEESVSYIILGSFSNEFRSFIRDHVFSQRSAEVLAADIEDRFPQYRGQLTSHQVKRRGERICLTYGPIMTEATKKG